jgi:hypothetical protein
MTEPFILIFNTTSNLPGHFTFSFSRTRTLPAQVVKTCYMPKVFASSFWSDRFETIGPRGADATTVCKNVTKSLTLLPPVGLDDQMPGRWFHGISERLYTHKQDEINSVGKTEKNENYFSSKLKTDGNIVFDPLSDCCDSLHSYQLMCKSKSQKFKSKLLRNLNLNLTQSQ